MTDTAEVRHRFLHHAPSKPEVAENHSYVRREIGNLAEDLAEWLPEGREKALVLAKLEEAMFWANASIARNQTDGS